MSDAFTYFYGHAVSDTLLFSPIPSFSISLALDFRVHYGHLVQLCTFSTCIVYPHSFYYHFTSFLRKLPSFICFIPLGHPKLPFFIVLFYTTTLIHSSLRYALFFLLMSYFLNGMDVVSSVWLLAIYPLSLFRRVRVRVIYYLSCLSISLSLPLCPCQSYHEVSELMSIY